MMALFFALPLLLSRPALAAHIQHWWTVSWLSASPDGFPRPVIGINGSWPCPTIHATKGDRISVHLTNALGNQTTGIHWHGISQVGTSAMDGSVATAQCPLSPGRGLTYSFVTDEGGTFWWHSHDLGQYPDGLRGALIVHDPDDPHKHLYDDEHIMTLTDWYHEQSFHLASRMISPSNNDFTPPVPEHLLVNDGQGATYNFTPGLSYRFRIINMAAIASFMVHFQDHFMTVIAIDASYVTARRGVDMLRIEPGQRYDVILEAKHCHKDESNHHDQEKEARNYPFLVAMDANRDYLNPDLPVAWNHNVTGYLVMNISDGLTGQDVVSRWDPLDDATLKPLPGTVPLPSADKVFELDFFFCKDRNNAPRACFDDHLGDPGPYVPPRVPSLYTAITTGTHNTDRRVYGHVHPLIVQYGDVVDLVVNTIGDPAVHPFHLHGHQFELLSRPPAGSGRWPGTPPADIYNLSRGNNRPDDLNRPRHYNPNPPRRDTYTIHGNSHAVIRFRADNPGVYLYHCHVDWHVLMGLTATVVEAPEMLRGYRVPGDHVEACRAGGMAYEGNAAGQVADVLSGEGIPDLNEFPYRGAMFEGGMDG